MVQLEEVKDDAFLEDQIGPNDDENDWDTDSGEFVFPLFYKNKKKTKGHQKKSKEGLLHCQIRQTSEKQHQKSVTKRPSS